MRHIAGSRIGEDRFGSRDRWVLRRDRVANHREQLAQVGSSAASDVVDRAAVLTAAGALHFQGPLHHSLIEAARLADLVFIVRIEEENEMKIAVADMADDGSV